ncbi:sensor histidine kinase [Streptomyces roseicoloratus]|uniref:sensor histidine kinase n=1 Tax=Streptomyces roseicoloratus TaxID=2508722 RepID=UPI0013E95129|nr:sensor histidine kinase [Streptomyces roseicoloratus]
MPPGILAGVLVIGLALSPARIRPTIAWCGLVAVILTVVSSMVTVRLCRTAEASRHARASAEAREAAAQREAALLGRLADQRTATTWMAEKLLPAAVARLRRGDATSDILYSVSFGEHLDDEFAKALRGALRTLLEAVEAEESTRDSSKRALVAVARRVQAIVHQLGKDLHTMQIVHGNDLALSRDLQKVDHRNALIGRLAASIAVMGDARPGRQWSKAIPLYDVLRGAMSRIVDFPRVKLQSVTQVAVIGPGAEPLMHLLAELLDNATSFSPPHTPVEVSASEVPSGIAIEIEDRGVGLTEEVRQRIARVMTQSQSGLFLAGLGEVTQLGLPVVARLAREHGCDVDLRTSAYGGVRAVVLVPRRLITTMEGPVVKIPEPVRKRLGGPNRPLTPPVGRRTARHAAPPVTPPMPSSVPPPVTPSVAPPVTPSAVPPVTPSVAPPVAEPVAETLTEGTSPFVAAEKTVNGLPRRRRESPVPPPIVRTGPEPASPSAGTSRPARQPGLMWEAFNGTRRSGAESPTPHSEPSDEVD